MIYITTFVFYTRQGCAGGVVTAECLDNQVNNVYLRFLYALRWSIGNIFAAIGFYLPGGGVLTAHPIPLCEPFRLGRILRV
ncbi:MAG: hypothetical protein ACRDBM_05300, partial [Sporomusa sp.]